MQKSSLNLGKPDKLMVPDRRKGVNGRISLNGKYISANECDCGVYDGEEAVYIWCGAFDFARI